MGKLHIVKRAAALLLSLLMLLGMYVNTSVAYVNAETPSLVNTFSPFKTALSDLVVSKKLEHPLGEDYEIPENITFDFEVDLGRSYADFTFDTTEETTVTADKNGVLSLTLKPGQSIGIEGIEVGTTATVTELPTELPGFSVKNDQKTVTATVNEQQAAIAEITNVYTPKSAKGGIVLAGEKLLTGRDWKDGDRFTVLLEMQEGEEWKNVAVREIVYDSENPAFNVFDFTDVMDALEYKAVGEYNFRLSELKGDIGGIAYDDTVYTFAVTVGDAEMDGALELQEIDYSDGMTVTYDDALDLFIMKANFTNKYQPAESILVDVVANKTVQVTGSGSMGADGFTFLLTNTDTGEEYTVVSDVNGKAAFGLIFKDGDAGKTFRYTLSEVNDGREYVTYSDAVYEIEITVMHNAEHQLEAIIKMNGRAVEQVVAEFENIYHYVPPAPPKPPVEPKPEQPKPGKPAPDTGDHSNSALVLWIMSISGAALVAVIAAGIIRKRRKNR